jgi:hypothetical protein
MPSTYEPIATTTLGSNAGSVTFSSVPSTYTDIIAICSIKLSGGSTIYTQVNADNGNNYSSTGLNGEASVASSSRNSNINSPLFGYSGNTTNFSTCIIQYMNYANTSINKTILGRGSATDYVTARVALWRNTAAINEIKILGSFATGSTFTIYGIKAA